MKEDRIGKLWYPDNGNGPFLKGSIQIMDKATASDVARQIENGERVKIVLWKNKWKKEGEKSSPDVTISVDRYVPGERKPDAPHVEQVAKAFDSDDFIPF